VWEVVKECKRGRGNLAQPCNLGYASAAAQEVRGWEAIKDGLFLKKSSSADPPNTSSENLLSTAVFINVKLTTAGRYYRVLTMVYNTQRYWVFGLCP
jgi:hypothetical protein